MFGFAILKSTLQHLVDVVFVVVNPGHVIQISRAIAYPILSNHYFGIIVTILNPIKQSVHPKRCNL